MVILSARLKWGTMMTPSASLVSSQGQILSKILTTYTMRVLMKKICSTQQAKKQEIWVQQSG
jgi:hypothetical protein